VSGNPALLAALLAHEAGTASAEDVYATLLEGELIVALSEPPEGAAAQFVAAPGPDGRVGLLTFSDPRTLAAWAEPPAQASVRAAELLLFVAAKGVEVVQLDPAGPVRVLLADGELAALAAGRVPTGEDLTAAPAAPEAPLQVAPPALPVEEHVLVALRAELAAVEPVRAAWVLEGPRRGLRRTFVVVLEPDDADGAPAAIAAAVPGLAERLSPHVAAEADLHFSVAEPSPLLDDLRAGTPPDYAR
jgi:SseB protein N-terminal domain